MSENNKSTYRTLAEALVFEKLGSIKNSLDHLDKRRLSVDEIKVLIKESFGKAKKSAEVKAKEVAKGWGDADIENQLKWVDALKLKEFFEPIEEREDYDDEDGDVPGEQEEPGELD